MKVSAIHTARPVEPTTTRSKRAGDKEGPSGEISVSLSDGARFVSDVRDAAAELGEVLTDEVERAERDIAEGKLDLTDMITAKLPFTRYNEGIEMLKRKEATKICFLPWAE